MLESKNTSVPDDKRAFEHGELSLVNLSGFTVGRADFRPGWRWTTDVKPLAGTESCRVAHSSYVVSGRMHVMMDDGRELDLGPGDAHLVGPGHDAWVVGDEPCVIIDFIPGSDNASATVADDDAAVRAVVEAYGDTMRRGDVTAVVDLFAADAAIMPGSYPTAAGRAQINDTYAAALAYATMDYSHEFDQVEVYGDTAVASTRSHGTTIAKASGEATPGRYRELFVLRREDAGWRIASYMFHAQPETA